MAEWSGRLDLGNGDMIAELAMVAAEPPHRDSDRPFLLVAMAHGWGPLPTPGARPRPGANTGLLIDAEDVDRFSAQPRMSAVPVRVRAVPGQITDGREETQGT